VHRRSSLFTRFDAGSEAIQKLAVIVTYAMAINVFFVGVEVFTALYSDIPHHVHHFQYLFVGLDGYSALAPWMWVGQALAVGCIVLLLQPRMRRRESVLAALCVGVIAAIWIEKGLTMVVAGFIIVATLIILKIVDLTMGLRVSQEGEVQGLDLSEHGEEGYIFS